MKVTLPARSLKGAIRAVSGLVPTKPTIPSLSHIRLEAANDTVTLKSTDLDRWSRISVAAAVEQPGDVLVLCRPFQSFVNKVPDAVDITVSCRVDPKTIGVAANQALARFPVLPSEDFCDVDDQDYDGAIAIANGDLERLLRRTQGAASANDTQVNLMGVNLSVAEGRLLAVATDGKRFHRATADVQSVDNVWPQVTVPSSAISEILSLASDIEGSVTLRANSRMIAASAGSYVFRSKLIAPKFIDVTFVDGLVPSHTAEVDCDDLAAAVSLCGATATAGARMQFDSDRLRIWTGKHSEIEGSVGRDMPANFDDPPNFHALNLKALTDLMAVSPRGAVMIEAIDTNKVVRFTFPGDPTFKAAIAPMANPGTQGEYPEAGQ